MWAIYKRELKSYFRSFIGLLFIAVTLFFISLYFTANNLISGYPYLSYTFSGMLTLFMLSVPILTMRSLAEERHSKTDQLILTAPVSVGGIVLGKYLAVLTVFAIPTAVVCTYPLIMSRFGGVPMAEAYLSVLGFFLYGAAAIAVGVLISSLTESQVIAAVLSFIVLFAGYMMYAICNLISSTGNWVTKILGCFDMSTPFYELLNGTLDLQSVIYFLCLIALALFLTVQSIQKRRYSVSAKNLSLGAYSTGMIALAVIAAVVINMVISELPSAWTKIDVTSEKLYSLTDQTKEYLKSIEEDVTIYVLVNRDNEDTTLGQTLERYADGSEHITVEYVDPNVNPRFYTQYTDSNVTTNSLIVVSDKRSKVVSYNSVYTVSYDYDSYTGSYSGNTTGYDGEGQITSALDYVLSDDMPKIYLLEGHGEASLSSTFTTAIKKENVDYETVNLMDYDSVPEDAAALFINGAVSDFSADDKDKIIAYLEQGGNVILVTSYTEEAMPNLDEVMAYMGLGRAEGLIVEQNTANYYHNPYYLLPTQESSVYTASIYGKYYVFVPFAQGIVIEDEEAEDMSYRAFLTTSEAAFSKVNIDTMQDYDKSEGDIDGPFAVGVSATKTLSDGSKANMVVYGSDQIFTDEANSIVSGANQMMFTNTIGNFADHEVSVSIPSKSYTASYLTVPQSKAVLIGIVTVLIIPIGCLAAGFVIWFRRRKR